WGMQPLAYGFLGGKYGAASRFPADDWRSRLPAGVRLTLAAAAAALPSFLPPAVRDRPLAEAALAWCLADPALERVVVGPRRPDQLDAVPRAAVLGALPELRALVEQIRQGARARCKIM